MKHRIIRIPEPLYLLGKEKQREAKRNNAPRVPALWECVFKSNNTKKNKEGWNLRL